MQFGDQRRPATGQPREDQRAPQRPAAIERVVDPLHRRSGQVLICRPWQQPEEPDVVVEIEGIVEGPLRVAEAEGRHAHPQSQSGDRRHRLAVGIESPFGVGSLVEYQERPHRRRQVGIRLQTPQHGLGIAELLIHLSSMAGSRVDRFGR